MSEPFISEIRLFSFNFAPRGWAECNGQLLSIAQNQALFSLLGTTYGGNGQTTFGLPDLRGRVPIHMGNGHVEGERAGQESHTLIISELPMHTHLPGATSATATQVSPSGNLWANGNQSAYISTANTSMNPAAVTNTGGSQPHENRSPFLTLNFCIALVGVFPSQN